MGDCVFCVCCLYGYLRFLNSMSESGVVRMYSNPFSISWVASLLSVVALHVHSSSLKFRS